MNFWAKGGISLSTTQFIACSCFYPYFFLGIIFIRHTVVLMALLYLWHLLIATPQSQSKTLNSAQIIQLQILLPLSPVLVFPANPAGYSWQNHTVSASYQLLPTLGTVSDFMLRCPQESHEISYPSFRKQQNHSSRKQHRLCKGLGLKILAELQGWEGELTSVLEVNWWSWKGVLVLRMRREKVRGKTKCTWQTPSPPQLNFSMLGLCSVLSSLFAGLIMHVQHLWGTFL